MFRATYIYIYASSSSYRIQRIEYLMFILGYDSPLFLLSFYWFLEVGWDWVHLARRPIFGLLYQPPMIDDECGVVCGIRIGRGNRSTRNKPAPVPLCPPQIPYDLTWDRTRAAAVGSRQLTAWAMARPYDSLLTILTTILTRDPRNSGSIPGRGITFSFSPQTGSGFHTAPYTIGVGGLFHIG
jgi:hypothetical protein